MLIIVIFFYSLLLVNNNILITIISVVAYQPLRTILAGQFTVQMTS